MWLPCVVTWQTEFPAGFQNRHGADGLVLCSGDMPHVGKRKKTAKISYCCQFVIFALKFRGALLLFIFLVLEPAAPLVMLMALDPLAAGCVHVSGTVRADE